MPEIVPNGIVYICKGIPWDDSYISVRKFASKTEQSTYISSKSKYNYNISYQRTNSTVTAQRPALTCRVPQLADNLQDCNYLMFQNTSMGSKWFYAFIKQINFINPYNTEIVYEIDHYQTYLFDYTVLPSFVEREHTNDDGLYKNLVPEQFTNLDLMTVDVTNELASKNDYYINIWATTDYTGKTANGKMIDNVYQGLEVTSYKSNDPAGEVGYIHVNEFINRFAETGKLDAIVGITMSPFKLEGNKAKKTITIERPTVFGDYVPHNKKLFTNPYVNISVTNNNGSNIVYNYENFKLYSIADAQPCEFDINYIGSYNASMMVSPVFYNGDTSIQGRNSAVNTIETGNFPACAWSGNAYANYLNTQYSGKVFSNIFNLLVGAIGVTAGATTSGASSLLGGVNSFISTEIERFNKSKNQGELGGTAANPVFNFKTDSVGFTFKRMAIRKETAKIIDGYFDLYGYATNEVKIPNETGRPSWNYVKTQRVSLKGSMPVDSMKAIKAMYNNGVTFWHTNDVGNYGLNNQLAEG